MENCVDIIQWQNRNWVILKSPGSARDPKGNAIDKIEMNLENARALAIQILEKLNELEVKSCILCNPQPTIPADIDLIVTETKN